MPANPPPIPLNELRDRLLGVPTTIHSDCSDRLDGLIGFCPVGSSSRLLGTAFIVRTRSGDNLCLYAAHTRPDRGDTLEDGVVSFSLADAPRLADAAWPRMEKEDRIRRRIAGGAERQSWIDEVLGEPARRVDQADYRQPTSRRP